MVLFECEEGAKKVLTLHQETPVKLELCDDLLCDWNQFLQAYQVQFCFKNDVIAIGEKGPILRIS